MLEKLFPLGWERTFYLALPCNEISINFSSISYFSIWHKQLYYSIDVNHLKALSLCVFFMQSMKKFKRKPYFHHYSDFTLYSTVLFTSLIRSPSNTSSGYRYVREISCLIPMTTLLL